MTPADVVYSLDRNINPKLGGFTGRLTVRISNQARTWFRAQFDALAGQHAEPRRRPQPREFSYQAGLANPGLPADQRDRRRQPLA